MKLNSKLFDSVRIHKPRRNGNAGDGWRGCCEWPGCNRPAAYRAPLARVEAEKARAGGRRQHHLFCLDHVRIYNRSYDYFAGMNNQQIDDFRKASLTGLRPTWAMGRQAGTRHVPGEWLRRRVQELLQRWQQDGKPAAASAASAPPRGAGRRPASLLPADREALKALGFVVNGTIPAGGEIKARYKSLVKRFHPDAQGAARSGDRLIRILRAHDHLKARAFF